MVPVVLAVEVVTLGVSGNVPPQAEPTYQVVIGGHGEALVPAPLDSPVRHPKHDARVADQELTPQEQRLEDFDAGEDAGPAPGGASSELLKDFPLLANTPTRFLPPHQHP